jgi:hypothetical protein
MPVPRFVWLTREAGECRVKLAQITAENAGFYINLAIPG